MTAVEEAPIGCYGWKGPSLPGLQYETADTSGIKILKTVDPATDMPPIVNQLQLGSCTANATARLFRGDTIRDGNDCGALSRLGVYYDERYLENDLGRGDTGAVGHDAFTAAQRWGIGPETEWPYVISTFQNPPASWASAEDYSIPLPQSAYKLTKPVKAVTPDLESVKAVLSNGQKIAVGFTVYASFESSDVASTGVVPMPQQGEQIVGGHEIVISGYDTETAYLICDNSWGTGWGVAGRMHMPVAYILSKRYASDWRTIQRPAAS